MNLKQFSEYISSYEGISEMLKTASYEDIIHCAAELLDADINLLNEYPLGGYSKGRTSGAYYFAVHDLKKNITKIDKVYNMLCDEKSRVIFYNLLLYRIVPDISLVNKSTDTDIPQYFDKGIISCDENEVFVDCGGFIGDTAMSYINEYGKYKKIYVYEPASENYAKCLENLKDKENIIIRNCGVGEVCTELAFNEHSSSSSFMGIDENDDSSEKISVINLDADIKDPVTYIKMDIEGFEIAAIIGAKDHIRNDKPKLAICTYHIISDVWEIPLLINSINPDYDYYVRHYMQNVNWETVLYAVPKKKPAAAVKEVRRGVAFPWMEGWRNVELTKDCGMIPYLLYKDHSMDISMVGAKTGEYPYAEELVKGLKMEFLATGSLDEKLSYIRENAADTDLLLLRGPYAVNTDIAEEYKKLNPAGKIYVGLDANSQWMDRIKWDDDVVIRLLDNCDVIATSCRSMQKHLNEKWPWKIEYIPNGYYDFLGTHSEPDYDAKENIILTVARIGSDQKANNIMLEAFAKAADKLPDWKMELIGSVEESFNGYISKFFEKNPHLKDRVIFTGPISDRNELFRHYAKAKVFTLTSTVEGGTPNVIAEALSSGCAVAVTRFDAWEDAIDSGRCGMSAKINDIDGVAAMYESLCTDPELEKLEKQAYENYKKNFDMVKITARLEEMLFGGDRI